MHAIFLLLKGNYYIGTRGGASKKVLGGAGRPAGRGKAGKGPPAGRGRRARQASSRRRAGAYAPPCVTGGSATGATQCKCLGMCCWLMNKRRTTDGKAS